MTCASYMAQPGAVLDRDEPVAQAARLLCANNFVALPVVDAGRRVVGLFGPRELATLLLPMGARLADEKFDFALGFVSEPASALHERLEAVAADAVGAHMAAHVPVRPATSLDEAVLRLHRGEAVLAVADDDGRLVGVLTAAAVLAPLVEGR